MHLDRSDTGLIASRDEQEVVLHDIPWKLYEGLAEARGEGRSPRLTYCEGVLEIMTPSTVHEQIAITIDRLIAAFAEHENIEIDGTRSWTMRKKKVSRGAEADLSYVLAGTYPEVAELAIEVIWKHGGLRKLDVYAGLGVPEVWFWRDGHFEIYVLGKRGYAQRRRSRLLPTLDLELLARFVRPTRQLAAVREYRAALTKLA
jgi:Uma2 family endonuclease